MTKILKFVFQHCEETLKSTMFQSYIMNKLNKIIL